MVAQHRLLVWVIVAVTVVILVRSAGLVGGGPSVQYAATLRPVAAATDPPNRAGSDWSDEGSSSAAAAPANVHPFWGTDDAATLRTTSRPCHSESYLEGKWVPDLDVGARHRYDGIGRVTGSCGKHRRMLHPEDPVRDTLKWRWEPAECDLLKFSEEAFCKALAGRDIMTAGDSIQEMWHTSIYHAYGGRGDLAMTEGVAARKPRCPTHAICKKYYKKPLKLFHLTNQFLELRTSKHVMRSWWRYIHNYGLLVLNSGAWMVIPKMPGVATKPVSDQRYAQLMSQAAQYLRRTYNGTVVFRTTYPGHPGCQNATGPLTEPQTGPIPREYRAFRWDAIPKRNEIAKRIFRGIGAHILDVAPMTALRPDGHVGQWHPKNWFFPRNGSKPIQQNKTTIDCLHYCIPGPMDTWTELLQNMLLGNLS